MLLEVQREFIGTWFAFKCFLIPVLPKPELCQHSCHKVELVPCMSWIPISFSVFDVYG